ncbi:hypothetical protein C7212DRAFT_341944 [Tuber magnatum]|uniref:Uncharacterized protein n=1 Tax=Tuber magnatum TaxID=42249 RepID=A0A317SYZ0_9PEZI|nr:hypothetical protein C7212DRAFT_341944 [Tuber magnatum]
MSPFRTSFTSWRACRSLSVSGEQLLLNLPSPYLSLIAKGVFGALGFDFGIGTPRFRPGLHHSTESNSVPAPEDSCPDGHGSKFQAMRRQAGGGNKTRPGNANDDPEEQFCCRKCALETGNYDELGGWKVPHMWQKQSATCLCSCCDTSFTTDSAVAKHIESGECRGGLSVPDFHKRIKDKNAPFVKKDPENISTGTTTTQTLRAGILPHRVEAALARTSDGFKPYKLSLRIPSSF